MPAESVGILMHKRLDGQRFVLLVHPGGPFWRGKDLGAWSIPKGEPEPGEDFEATARREFAEELGTAPEGPLLPLGRIRQRGGKAVTAFAIAGDLDVSRARSSEFELEWPPRSGRIQSFPEVDRAEWFDLTTARHKILEAQRPLLDRLEEILAVEG
jgi:predicted NUDIX family NTP pyrophosphohydrolase